ncbi:MAG TPA: serine protease [Cyclobacteriaceae bacterium]|nr:serine protease [Cyclobacteriaceae bacterium]
MKLPNDIKKCVVFIGIQKADQTIIIVGTGFIVYDDVSNKDKSYLVTAKHVIEGIKGKGVDEAMVRMNLVDGTSQWYATTIKEWILNTDSNVDVAVFQTSGEKSWDHVAYQLSASMTEKLIAENEIDVGDEVFIIGLFTHHHGRQKNIPIARIGNIAALAEEKTQTRDHLMDAYLIEARSIGGLSGSPVFVNLGSVRYVMGSVKQSTNGSAFLLMGLIYGHYDVSSTNIDEAQEDQSSVTDRVNTGIAIVTPVEKILETIQQN